MENGTHGRTYTLGTSLFFFPPPAALFVFSQVVPRLMRKARETPPQAAPRTSIACQRVMPIIVPNPAGIAGAVSRRCAPDPCVHCPHSHPHPHCSARQGARHSPLVLQILAPSLCWQSSGARPASFSGRPGLEQRHGRRFRRSVGSERRVCSAPMARRLGGASAPRAALPRCFPEPHGVRAAACQLGARGG